MSYKRDAPTSKYVPPHLRGEADGGNNRAFTRNNNANKSFNVNDSNMNDNKSSNRNDRFADKSDNKYSGIFSSRIGKKNDSL